MDKLLKQIESEVESNIKEIQEAEDVWHFASCKNCGCVFDTTITSTCKVCSGNNKENQLNNILKEDKEVLEKLSKE